MHNKQPYLINTDKSNEAWINNEPNTTEQSEKTSIGNTLVMQGCNYPANRGTCAIMYLTNTDKSSKVISNSYGH